jgi:hypothetical protein
MPDVIIISLNIHCRVLEEGYCKPLSTLMDVASSNWKIVLELTIVAQTLERIKNESLQTLCPSTRTTLTYIYLFGPKGLGKVGPGRPQCPLPSIVPR